MSLSEYLNRKFVDSINLSEWQIETDTGWEDVTHIHKTISYDKWRLELDNGIFLECADDHIVFDENFQEIFVKDLIPGKSIIQTKSGPHKVTHVENLNTSEHMYDITVDSDNHRYYTNDVLSHNTAFIDAITFSLYKKAYRNINLPQLVNNINQKDCVAEIEFSIGDTEWMVRRGLAPNIFEIYKNGEILDQHSSVIEQQKWLEQNVLKMSYKTFIQIVILGSSAFIPFMQLVPADRRDVIEDLLDIKLFSSMNILVKEKIKEFKDNVKILSIKKDSYEDKVSMQRNFIDEIEKRSRDDIQEKTDTISELFSSIESLQSKNDEINLDIQKLNETLDDLVGVSDKLKTLLANKTKLTVEAKNLKETTNFFVNNDVCPTCSQHIDDEFKKSKQKDIKNQMSSLKKTYDSLILTIDEETQRQDQFKKTSEETNTLNQKISYNNYQISQAQNRIKELHVQIKRLTDAINNKNDEHQKLEEYNQTLDDIKTDIAELKEEIHHYDYVQLILKDSGVKSRIIEKYLKIINQQINKYLNLLELYVNFNLDSEFNEKITTPTFESFSYGNFSEGQKRRVDLALLFTWRYISTMKNSANTNLLICDEILDGSLDEMGHFAFLKIIKEEMKNSNIFVISHRDGIEHRFDKVITIEKRGNFTVKSES
jgi:DNA repair exonuclease SbcCD ATPase subunit